VHVLDKSRIKWIDANSSLLVHSIWRNW